MSKRSNEDEISENINNKYQKVLKETEIASLPDEMIVEIFSKLNNIEDLRSCKLVCKKFRELILRSQKIMQRIWIAFKYVENDKKMQENLEKNDILQFIDDNGAGIRNIRIRYNSNLIFILKQMPNLEELRFTTYWKTQIDPNTDSSFSLPKLKVLNICGKISNFISNSRDINNLTTLNITYYDLNENEILTNFVAQQNNLKEISISDPKNYGNFLSFPTRDISREFGCKLRRLLYNYPSCIFNEDFLKFLTCQLESLTELDLWGVLSPEILDVIFKNGKKLERLILRTRWDIRLCESDYPHWVLPSVKFYSTKYSSSAEFYRTLKRFPNVVSLRFANLYDVTATLPYLESLYIEELDCDKLLNLKMPNLKKLIVKQISIRNVKEFSQNIPNLEIFINDSSHINTDLSYLKNFTKLQRFEYRFGNPSLLRVLVNFTEKVVYSDGYQWLVTKVFHNNFPQFRFEEKRFKKVS